MTLFGPFSAALNKHLSVSVRPFIPKSRYITDSLLAIADSEDARMTSAYELVDWLRLADVTPAPAEISCLASAIRRFHHPALKTLLQFLHPSEGQLWESGILDSLEELVLLALGAKKISDLFAGFALKSTLSCYSTIAVKPNLEMYDVGQSSCVHFFHGTCLP